MIHRNISGALLEICHGVTARLHQFFDHRVCLLNRRRRFIHEVGLRFFPRMGKTSLLFGCEAADLQLVNAFLPRCQFRLGFALVAVLIHGMFIFGTELFSQIFSSATPKVQVKGSWNAVKGKLKQKYAQLTDDDLTFSEGKEDEFLGRLQQKLGKSKEDLRAEIEKL